MLFYETTYNSGSKVYKKLLTYDVGTLKRNVLGLNISLFGMKG